MMDSELKQYLDEFSERNAAEFRQIRTEFQQMREGTAAEFRQMRGETAAEFQQMRGETAAEFRQIRTEFQQMRGETAAEFRQVREENASAHEETRRVLRGEMAEAVSTLRRENAVMHEETRRHFDVVAEGLESRFNLLAEHVQTVDQKLDREVADIRAEMRRTPPRHTRSR